LLKLALNTNQSINQFRSIFIDLFALISTPDYTLCHPFKSGLKQSGNCIFFLMSVGKMKTKQKQITQDKPRIIS
jgi:hypothetical protein